MTDADWQTGTDPTPMLEYLRGKVSDRKVLLLAVACARRVSPLLRGDGDRGHPAVEVAERAADETAAERAGWLAVNRFPEADETAAERAGRLAANRLLEAIRVAGDDLMYRAGYYLHEAFPLFSPEAVARAAERVAAYSREPARPFPNTDPLSFDERSAVEQAAQAGLVRDIFGPLPFRPATADLSWLTSSVVGLARAMYDGRDFSAMPILADALEEAGCGNADVLAHCRTPGPHVRGCWVVDLVLGKA